MLFAQGCITHSSMKIQGARIVSRTYQYSCSFVAVAYLRLPRLPTGSDRGCLLSGFTVISRPEKKKWQFPPEEWMDQVLAERILCADSDGGLIAGRQREPET